MKRWHRASGVYLIPVSLTLSIAVGIWMLLWPIPSDEIVFASAHRGGTYHHWAQQYAQRLAQRGISVRVLETGGSHDNFKRMIDPQAQVDVTFLQGGISGQKSAHVANRTLLSLGRVDVEPVWVFSRVPGLQRLDQLEGLRVAMGPVGSGTRALGHTLLEQARVTPESLHLMDVSHEQGAVALAQGKLDVMFSALPAEAPVIYTALRTPGVSLVNLQSVALTQRVPFLQIRLLARGVLDPQIPLPAQDMTIMVVPTELVVRANLHPSLQRQLIDVAHDIHGQAGLFRRKGELPAGNLLEWPASPEIRLMATESLSFLEQRIPFWQAQFVLRLIYLIMPALLIGLLLGVGWRKYRMLHAQSRLIRWYGELRLIERDLTETQGNSLSSHRHVLRLRSIREHLAQTPIPPSLKERQLKLLEHIDFVRIRIHKLRGR